MKSIVQKEGLIIPKKFLRGIRKADIRWEKGKIIVEPKIVEKDTIFTLGTNPCHSGIKDLSIHHDKYLYEDDK